MKPVIPRCIALHSDVRLEAEIAPLRGVSVHFPNLRGPGAEKPINLVIFARMLQRCRMETACTSRPPLPDPCCSDTNASMAGTIDRCDEPPGSGVCCKPSEPEFGPTVSQLQSKSTACIRETHARSGRIALQKRH